MRSLLVNCVDRNDPRGLTSVTLMQGSPSYPAEITRRRTCGWMLFAIFALTMGAQSLYAGIPRNQRHELRHEIFHLEDAWRDAVLSSNTSAMASLLGDDYIAITSFGTLETKEETLAGFRSGKVRFTTLLVSDRKVRFYGSTALVTSRAEVQATTPDGPVQGNFRYTHVYVRDPQGKWKIVNFEASKIREPDDMK